MEKCSFLSLSHSDKKLWQIFVVKRDSNSHFCFVQILSSQLQFTFLENATEPCDCVPGSFFHTDSCQPVQLYTCQPSSWFSFRLCERVSIVQMIKCERVSIVQMIKCERVSIVQMIKCERVSIVQMIKCLTNIAVKNLLKVAIFPPF